MVHLTNSMIRIKRSEEFQPTFASTAPCYMLEGLDGFRATCCGFDKVGMALRHSFIFKSEDLKMARLVLEFNPAAQVTLDASPVHNC